MSIKLRKAIPYIIYPALVIPISGCSNFQAKPISPVPQGVSISGTANGGYVVESVEISKESVSPTPSSLEFCFAQNIPNIKGSPTLNPSGNKITAQGREQVSFVVPRTMGSSLNYDLNYSATAHDKEEILLFTFENIKIKGTWSNRENPLPASQSAHLYVESSLQEFNSTTNKLYSCLAEES